MLDNTKICHILSFGSNNTNNIGVSWKDFSYSSQGPNCPFLVLITKHHEIRINYSSKGRSCAFLVLITKHLEIRILKLFLSAFHFSLLFSAGRFCRIHLTQNILVTVWTMFYFCFNLVSTARLLITSIVDYLHTRKWFGVNASELSKTTLTLVNERQLIAIDNWFHFCQEWIHAVICKLSILNNTFQRLFCNLDHWRRSAGHPRAT